MKTSQIICTIIVGLSLVLNLSVFLIRKRNIKIRNQVKMRIKKIKVTDYLSFFFGFVFIGIGLWDYKTETDFQYVFWIILGITVLVSGILNAGDYIIIDSRGIRDYSFLKWDSISSISKNKYNPTEIIFGSERKNLSIDFNSAEKIDEFKNILKQIKPDIFEKYMNEI